MVGRQREYRLLNQRRRAAWIETHRTPNHPDAEAERLIGFARVWAPFGGASEEDILVHFGMTPHRFINRLWQAIAESECDHDEILNFARVYPRRHEPTRTPSH